MPKSRAAEVHCNIVKNSNYVTADWRPLREFHVESLVGESLRGPW